MNTANLIYLLLALVVMFPTLAFLFRRQGAARNALIWLAIVTALTLGYNYAHNKHWFGLGYGPVTPGGSDAPEGDVPKVREI